MAVGHGSSSRGLLAVIVKKKCYKLHCLLIQFIIEQRSSDIYLQCGLGMVLLKLTMKIKLTRVFLLLLLNKNIKRLATLTNVNWNVDNLLVVDVFHVMVMSVIATAEIATAEISATEVSTLEASEAVVQATLLLLLLLGKRHRDQQ